jgi:phosphoribosylformylglycinamidine cyclo-ligase
MWRTFNCGIGFVLVVPAARQGEVERALEGEGLAHRAIGRVVTARGDERVRFA